MDTAAASWPPESRPALGDELMTADRREQKYLLERQSAGELQRVLDARFERHFPPEVTRLPGAQQFSTTIYFDTPSRHLYQLASTEDTNVKLRAREYYNLDPSMVQLARRPEQLVRFDPVLWFELKAKRGNQVRKQRFGIPKQHVPSFLAAGHITQEMVDLQAEQHGPKAREALGEIAELCRSYGEPFEVDCIVNYRRIAWQNPEGTLRLTLDRQVSFFEAPSDIWSRRFALIKETLGTAKGVIDDCILEVKSRGPLPDWLAQALTLAKSERAEVSKFVSASSAVHA